MEVVFEGFNSVGGPGRTVGTMVAFLSNLIEAGLKACLMVLS
jgi:hypothetical protein